MRYSWKIGSLLCGFAIQAWSADRCDLVSRRCLDLTSNNGASLTVSASTTRIPLDGLVLCEIPGSAPPPTDIVYAIDQSSSMKPTYIYVSGQDTTGWYGCSNISSSGSVTFHGQSVYVINSTVSASQVASACSPAGDPFAARADAVKAALQAQAAKSPESYAATISFNSAITSTQDSMTQLGASGLAKLLTTATIDEGTGTNYENTLEWARILLYGGYNAQGVHLHPHDSATAVILISDGQPNKGVWSNAINKMDTTLMTASMFGNSPNASLDAGVWHEDSAKVPRVYGIYLGSSATEAATLSTISSTTGGAFYQIPPSQPDSLGRVIDKILGTLIKSAVPTQFDVRNLSNGYSSSVSVSSYDAGAGGYRMSLDSIVPLEPGVNKIVLTATALINGSDSTIRDTISITVAGSSTADGTRGLDTSLTTTCYPTTTLKLSPDVSGLSYCEASKQDANIVVGLTTVPGSLNTLPVTLRTTGKADQEQLSLSVPSSAVDSVLGTFASRIPWGTLVAGAAVSGNGTVQSGIGWDSAIATFQMPRDKRDTASARIALHRPSNPTLALSSPVDGPTGTISATVVDSMATSSSVVLSLRNGDGTDTLSLTLVRSASYVYTGSFGFAQGTSVTKKDSILQLGPADGKNDTVIGLYAGEDTAQAIAVVEPASVRLRFLNASGGTQDTLSFVEAMGERTSVTVAMYIGGSLCASCDGLLALSASDAGLGILSTSGGAISSIRLSGGKATVQVRGIAPVLAGTLTFTCDSLGLSLAASPLQVVPPAPDSAVYLDMDGDGALDRVVLHLKTAWSNGQTYSLPWPDSNRLLDLSKASVSVSSDGLTATCDFPVGVRPDTTGTTTALAGSWLYASGWSWRSFPVIERIAPVPLKAVLTRGTIYDTLRIYPSERLSSNLASWKSLVGRVASGAQDSLSPVSATVEASTGALVLLFKADSTFLQVNPGDSVRFLSSVEDTLGNAPGLAAKTVVVQGADPSPKGALIVDSDADGRADRIYVYLRSPLVVTDSIGFSWPDTNGVLQARNLVPSAGKASATGDTLVFDVDPFQFAATSCPAGGCGALGYISSSRFGSAIRSDFAIQDGVDPIPTSARYRYSMDGKSFDTLIVRFSEPVQKTADTSWASVGRPARDSLGVVVKPLSQAAFSLYDGGRTAWLPVDSTFPGLDGDSLRITSSTASGRLSDTALNAPGRLAFWTPILWGHPRPFLTLTVPHAVVRSGTLAAPVGEEPISVMTLQGTTSSDTSSWQTVEGPVLTKTDLDTRIGGVVVHLNRIPQTLGLYIYDNLGVMVLHKDLSDLAAQAAQGKLSQTHRGDYLLWLGWDGLDQNGQPVASGVYYFRVYGWIKEGSRLLLMNQIRNTGFYRDLSK